jgi:ketosteroid isomerase-like protein
MKRRNLSDNFQPTETRGAFVTDSAAAVRQVIERLREAMETGRHEEFVAQFAPDGVYETPFALAGAPSRWEGFDAVREHLLGVSSARSVLDFTSVEAIVHPGADPAEAVVRFVITGKVISTGEAFVLPSSVGIIRVRDGKIVSYLDYPNVLRGAQLTGNLQRLTASLAPPKG